MHIFKSDLIVERNLLLFDIFLSFDLGYPCNNIENLLCTNFALNDVQDMRLQLQGREHRDDECLCDRNNFIDLVWLVSAWITDIVFHKHCGNVIAVNKEPKNTDSDHKIKEGANMTRFVWHFVAILSTLVISLNNMLFLGEGYDKF